MDEGRGGGGGGGGGGCGGPKHKQEKWKEKQDPAKKNKNSSQDTLAINASYPMLTKILASNFPFPKMRSLRPGTLRRNTKNRAANFELPRRERKTDTKKKKKEKD